MSSIRFLVSTAFAVAFMSVAPVSAQTSDQVQNFLDELLGGRKANPAPGNGRIILRSPERIEDPQDQQPKAQNQRPADEFRRRGDAVEDAIAGREIPQSRQQMQLSFAPLVRTTENSVVNIFADRMVRDRSPFANDPFFEQFFGRRSPNRQRGSRMQNSLGSGVIVNANGTIITNNHVVANADQIRVVLGDGREFQAELLVKDEDTDLAVLRINAGEDLPALALADSDDLAVGDLVLAIGNPFGVGKTVTSGIVSALARARSSLSDFGFFIQTDAAINPGNSGGALIDMEGNLVGVNTAIYSRSGGSNGIGFAIPSNMVRVILRSAEGKSGDQPGRVEKPYLGAQFQAVTNDIAQQLGMRTPQGALIVSVDPDGPADKAGMRAGDVVLVINKEPVKNPDGLNYRLYTAGVSEDVTFKVLRRRRVLDFNVKLVDQADAPPADETEIKGRTPFAGAFVANADRRLLRELRVRTNTPRGVVVTKILRGSTAQRFIQAGDFFREINGVRIRNVEDLRRVVTKGGREWNYVIERNGRVMRQYLRC